MGKYNKNIDENITMTTSNNSNKFNNISFKFMVTVGSVVAVLIASFFLFIFLMIQSHIITDDNTYCTIQSAKIILFICAVIMIIGIDGLIFFLIDGMIVKPINNLKNGAKIIGEGNLEYIIPVKNSDEIGALGSAFNTMASELVKTIHDVKESEAKWHTIFDDSLEGIMLIDGETGQIFDCNSEFEIQNGRKKENLKKMKIWEIVASKNMDVVKSRFHHIIKTGIGCSNEIEFQKPDGELIYIEFINSVVTIKEKRYILCMTRDLTGRKHAEEKLKNYADDLKRSNELKDLFTDIMRHDLLNPAGIVKGYTEVLTGMEYDEKKLKILHKIEKNNKKLIHLIETTAKFAKLESVDDFEFSENDIAAIFKRVLNNFRPQIKNKQIKIEFIAKGVYEANVNSIIEEVFANLLSNAIKYSPKGSKIIVDIIDSNENWKVTVTDFGEGVLDEHKTLLFDRFKRVNKVAVKGSGLGLAIVKRIITLHGGNVGVEDNPQGQGSVFWITVKKA